MDIRSIEPGQHFRRVIASTIASCDALLALIGPQWLESRVTEHTLTDDYVRLEIGLALRSGKLVIPVLLDDAIMPKKENLPDDIQGLIDLHAVQMNHQTFDEGAGRLIQQIRGTRPVVIRRLTRVLLSATIGIAGIAYFALQPYRPRKASPPLSSGTPIGSENKTAAPIDTFEFPPALAFQTGWILVGYYRSDIQKYTEGPYAEPVESAGASAKPTRVPILGDVLLIKKIRRVVISDFRNSGLRYRMKSPPLVRDPITDDDETGVTLPKGSLVLTRDVEVSGYAGRPDSIWCRIVACDPDIAQCAQARQRLAGLGR